MNSLLISSSCCFSSSPMNINIAKKLTFHRQSLLYIPDIKLKNIKSTKFICNSTSSSDGESDSKSVLDAFFLGKALAEAVNERVESAVGEFLSTVGRLQAEQQKQVQEFQEEVLERAKKAKEIAAREAMEAQRVIRKPSTTVVSAAAGDTISVKITTPADSTDSSDSVTYDVGTDLGPSEVPIDD